MATRRVEPLAETLVAGVPPTVTVVEGREVGPLQGDQVPPAVEPASGLTRVTVGDGWAAPVST